MKMLFLFFFAASLLVAAASEAAASVAAEYVALVEERRESLISSLFKKHKRRNTQVIAQYVAKGYTHSDKRITKLVEAGMLSLQEGNKDQAEEVWRTLLSDILLFDAEHTDLAVMAREEELVKGIDLSKSKTKNFLVSDINTITAVYHSLVTLYHMQGGQTKKLYSLLNNLLKVDPVNTDALTARYTPLYAHHYIYIYIYIYTIYTHYIYTLIHTHYTHHYIYYIYTLYIHTNTYTLYTPYTLSDRIYSRKMDV